LIQPRADYGVAGAAGVVVAGAAGVVVAGAAGVVVVAGAAGAVVSAGVVVVPVLVPELFIRKSAMMITTTTTMMPIITFLFTSNLHFGADSTRQSHIGSLL